jgi:hypothetical protein
MLRVGAILLAVSFLGSLEGCTSKAGIVFDPTPETSVSSVGKTT